MRALVLISVLSGCHRGIRVPDGQRCAVEGDERACTHDTTRVRWGRLSSRKVHYQTPLGSPPQEGWPVAILFQGSLHPAKTFWSAKRGDAFGGWHQVGVVEELLDAGFAVVTPSAANGAWWQTNVLPYAAAWTASPDHQLMLALFDAIDAGELGPLDDDHLVAAGISSGGYMTSRMAASYPGRFEALAIQSASWATCSGAVCVLPDALPEDHPPTLFLHGADDVVVPPRTMEPYADALAADGVPVEVLLDDDAGHAWLAEAPEAVVEWFVDPP